MSDISAKDVMKLRNATGLSMMECKKALVEAGGDAEKAEDLLRKKLKGKLETRTQHAGEGRIAVAIDQAAAAAAIIELRAETDFTAKNENFVKAAARCADLALAAQPGDIPATPEISAILDQVRISTGENCSYARGHKLVGQAGAAAFGSYVHHDGKIGVLILAEGSVTDETLRQVCMHVAAAVPRPAGVSTDDIPPAVVDRERRFRIDQAMESGKPQAIAEKMVEGAMRKFFEEVALLEQPFIMDQTRKVRDVIGDQARILAFLRWQVGESA